MVYIYSNEENWDMMCIFIKNNMNTRLAAAEYAQKFPQREKPSPNHFFVMRQNLKEHGSFNKPKEYLHRMRPRRIRTADAQADIIGAITADPSTSGRVLAREQHISRSSVQRILKEKKFHPFKVFLTQQLSDNDFERRLDFIAWFTEYKIEEPNLDSNIFWTDEATFHQNGNVNRHNSHYWAIENPHWIREQHVQQRFSVNVWCGLVNDKLVGPYFMDERLDGRAFLRFLRYRLDNLLEDVPLRTRQKMIFQLDGAPAHKFHKVASFLNRKYPGKWIGLNGPVKWPPRSPDLTPLDFFLWGYLKELVYQEPVHNADELKERIRQKCAEIPGAMIRRATLAVNNRCMICALHHGQQFEQFL